MELTTPRYPVLWILLFGFLAYGATLRVGFMVDDHSMIVENDHIKEVSWENVTRAFSGDVFDGRGDAYFRPLQTLANMVDFRIWGTNSYGYHLTNLALHIGCGVALFYLLAAFLGSGAPAFMAAVMFVVHPNNAEQLLVISGRAGIMAMLFMLLALIVSTKKNFLSQLGVAFLFALASLSKESGLVFPFLLLLLQFENKKFKVAGYWYAVYGIWMAAYLYMRHRAVGPVVDLPNLLNTVRFFFLDLPTIIVSYFQIWLLPIDIHSHRRMIFSGWEMAASIFVLGALAYLCYRFRLRYLIVGLIWFGIGFLPKIPILATNSLMLDHWLFVSSAGLCFGLTMEIFRWMDKKNNKNLGLFLLSGMVFFWLACSIFNIAMRRSEQKLYEWAIRFPTSSVVRQNLGYIYYRQGQYLSAQKLLEQAIKMNPNPLAKNTLALTHWKQGKKTLAIERLSQVREESPEFLPTYYNRALIVRGERGLNDLSIYLERKEDNEKAWLLQAQIYYELGKIPEAMDSYQEILNRNPRSLEALINLGYLNAIQGHFENAKEFWIRAFQLDPENEAVAKNLIWLETHTLDENLN